MSSITTDSIKFHQEIKRRLTTDFDSEWTPLWIYSEMTSMLIYGFSFSLLINQGIQTHKLFYRNWNNENLNRNQFGIFNLGLIKIDEEEILVSLSKISEIQELIKREIVVTEEKGIVLDGYQKEFIHYKSEKKLNWNLDERVNSNLALLIRKIKKLKNT